MLKRLNIWFSDNLKFRLIRTNGERPSVFYAKEEVKENSVCVEIGTFKGGNAVRIMEVLNPKKLYVIDPWEEYGVNVEEQQGENLSKIAYNSAKRKLEKYGDRVVFLKMVSDEAVKFIEEEVDFVYVDGLHTYEQCLKDIENYFPLLKSGGVMGGHDISFPSVFKSISEFSIRKNLRVTVSEPDWYFKKS